MTRAPDDYLIKHFEKDELRAGILIGLRMMALQDALGGHS